MGPKAYSALGPRSHASTEDRSYNIYMADRGFPLKLWTAAFLAATLLPLQASALKNVSGADKIEEEVSDLKDAVNNNTTSLSQIAWMAGFFSDRMPSTRITVHTDLRGWDFPKGDQASGPATMDDLYTAANKQITDLSASIPSPLLVDYQQAREMKGKGKVTYNAAMKKEELGVYNYKSGALVLGSIWLNKTLALVASFPGFSKDVFALAFAVVIHEANHAVNHLRGILSPTKVVDGEVLAFKAQYRWLKMVDPYGEKIAYLRTKLINQMSREPSPLTKESLTFFNHLAEIYATDGDESNIRAMVHKLGYEDGHDHATAPSS